MATERRESKSWGVLRVITNRLLEQSQRLPHVPLRGKKHRKGAQI
jgi:hypothetical protein